MKILMMFFFSIFVFSVNIFAANTQKLATPYWQFIYKGNGQISLQENSLFKPDFNVDNLTSNINGWLFNTLSTNIMTGFVDIPPVILWVLNDDGKGKLVVKSNTKQNKISAQLFSIVCSNSGLKKISIKVNKYSLTCFSKPLSGLVKNLFFRNFIFPQSIFADGNIDSISINSDLYATLIYAKNLGVVKFKNATFTGIFTGEPVKIEDNIIAGTTTNNNVIFFGSGNIDKIIANRLENTAISAGGTFLSCKMEEANSVFSIPAYSPKGTIGLIKARELAGWGERNDDDQKWYVSKEMIYNRTGLILASKINKFKIKTLVKEGTSVYIHGR